jgi:predicted nucleic acid-binding protein
MHLFDSNILIYRLNDVLPPTASRRAETWTAEGAFVSVVTRIEVLGYPDQTLDQTRRAFALLDLFAELPLREPVVQSAIRLRRRHSIRLGDAIIAATAPEHDLSLVTRNTGDFEWTDGLSLLNPFED